MSTVIMMGCNVLRLVHLWQIGKSQKPYNTFNVYVTETKHSGLTDLMMTPTMVYDIKGMFLMTGNICHNMGKFENMRENGIQRVYMQVYWVYDKQCT